jgi:mRNA interferase YafQ
MLRLAPSGRFKRDVKRAAKRGKEMHKLREAIDLLLTGAPLPASYRDHSLRGNWIGWRDLHIEPDWLLIYRIAHGRLELAASGTHADLFDE